MPEIRSNHKIKYIPFVAAVVALLFNGLGALYGGLSLIRHPDGSGIGLDLALLHGSGLSDFRMPGVVLLVTNGLIDLMVLGALLFRVQRYHLFVIAQGLLLLGWLMIQVILIRTLDQMHLIMALTAIVLVVSGITLVPFKRMRS